MIFNQINFLQLRMERVRSSYDYFLSLLPSFYYCKELPSLITIKKNEKREHFQVGHNVSLSSV